MLNLSDRDKLSADLKLAIENGELMSEDWHPESPHKRPMRLRGERYHFNYAL